MTERDFTILLAWQEARLMLEDRQREIFPRLKALG